MEREIWILALFSLFAQCLCDDVFRTDVVYTNSGPVRGIWNTTVWNSIEYAAFLGIPYAKPPLANLRFTAPVPITPWEDVFEADTEGSACAQIDIFDDVFRGSEDCLKLNVYTREYGDGVELKPVMVWIYGGAFVSGYSDKALYGPDFFLEQDVIFVSFNYRVGILGFLNVDHPFVSANAGLKDQHMVLQWVQDNIAAFGGDPNRVTIFGESAGAVSVAFHVLSEKSKGLFQQVIYQSGSPLCQWGYQTAQVAANRAKIMGKLLGYNYSNKKGLLNFLREVPITDLIVKQMDVNLGILSFGPSLENSDAIANGTAFIDKCPIYKYRTGNFNQVPTLMGWNKDEAIFFINYFFMHSSHDASLWRWLQQKFGINHFPNTILGLWINKFLKHWPKEFIKLFEEFVTAVAFKAPIDLTQQFIAKSNGGQPVYYYMLSYTSMYNMHSSMGETINGTSHVDDIGYLFNVAKLNSPTDPNYFFNQFRKKMVSLWTNFAKYGNPTPQGLADTTTFNVVWSDSTQTDGILEINENATMRQRSNVLGDWTSFYEKHLRKYLPLQNGCPGTFQNNNGSIQIVN